MLEIVHANYESIQKTISSHYQLHQHYIVYVYVLLCRPVSAYALFFRDTHAAIKGQNPNALFSEVSKIVASMWDVLAPEHKNVSIFAIKNTKLEDCGKKGKKVHKIWMKIIMEIQFSASTHLELLSLYV